MQVEEGGGKEVGVGLLPACMTMVVTTADVKRMAVTYNPAATREAPQPPSRRNPDTLRWGRWIIKKGVKREINGCTWT
jgi:hypothetical protein